MAFHTSSYQKHAEKSPNTEKMATWTDESTVDYWRHARMYNNLLPIIQQYPNSSWLTVGDGRYGTDAHYLNKHGIQALATDISATYLETAKALGYIDDYRIENAEKLSFADQSYDFVLCKEAYHHFPRPSIAIYEMLRVARKGIVLIEPNDHNILGQGTTILSGISQLWQSVKNEIKLLFDKPIYYHHGNYEPDGNFVFSISEREIEKIALGIDLPVVAFKGMDDCYIEGVEHEKISDNGPLFREVKNRIKAAEAMSKKALKNYGLLTAVIFKIDIEAETSKSLRDFGFRVDHLPRNPFA